MTQITMSELSAVSWVKTLNATQQRILKLLSTGDHTQSQIADRLRITRQYVCQFTKKLLKLKLIKKSDKTPGSYNVWYDPIPHLKKQIDHETPDINYTACRVHNIRVKYKITEQSGPICTDHRTGYDCSWEMRGGTRHKFFVRGSAGKLNITIDVHPKSIVVYPNAGQSIYAESIDDAELITTTTIHDAVLKFLKDQSLFGTHIEIENPSRVGKLISKIHYAFEFSKNAPHAEEQTKLEGSWIDDSPKKHGKPGYSEFETENKTEATELDKGIQTLRTLGRGNVLKLMIQEFPELCENVRQIMTQIREIQAGIS